VPNGVVWALSIPYLRGMEDTATDYKLLYEQAIAAHKKSLE